jgi:hypothetical protein
MVKATVLRKLAQRGLCDPFTNHLFRFLFDRCFDVIMTSWKLIRQTFQKKGSNFTRTGA